MSLTQRLLNIHGRYGGGSVGVPVGVIAIWSGTLATIPTNWSLCDGTGGTPNLVARFLRGAPAATELGTTGGADSHAHASMTSAGSHTHTAENQSHSHTVNSAGDHSHASPPAKLAGAAVSTATASAGAHQHTVSSGSHSHTMDTTVNHTHVISTNDGRPPYYEVAYIQAGAGALVAANLIIIWTGTLVTIPVGWSLCDGGGGRPDLRSRFVRGVNTNVTNPGTTGGNATHGHTETAQAAHSHTMDNSGTHSHTFSAYTWTHNHNQTNGGGGGSTDNVVQSDTNAGDHTHAASDSIGSHNHNAMGNDGGHSHTVNTASSLPSYYDVAYIINDGGAIIIPSNGVIIWTGLLANIPAGYSQHAGLLGRFARGSDAGINPGGTGGNDTHTHTDQNAGAHSAHSMVSTGAHQHAATDSIGAHTHTKSAANLTVDSAAVLSGYSSGNHSHTYNNENNHTHTLTNPGDHVHNPWSTDDGRPAYYEVAFIIKA